MAFKNVWIQESQSSLLNPKYISFIMADEENMHFLNASTYLRPLETNGITRIVSIELKV
ncbi:hypothetical protein GCM10007096_35870 [Pullulanibacillus pueri]|uniref:Uncharacterized protein n=1 Tax=Pullulanibacillus pueri TaxID=1437324 RepID=A0A8J3A018_9BACL|nr:hypothetical protein GCM10007096_35870 [Pullulanibacillus pueri]